MKGQPGALKIRVRGNFPGHSDLRKRAAAGSEPFPTTVLPGGAGDVLHSLIPGGENCWNFTEQSVIFIIMFVMMIIRIH